MKRRFSILLALCLCISTLCGTAMADVVNANDEDSFTNETQVVTSFPDVPASAPYAEAVSTLHEYGIINGDNKGNFNPNSSVTRAEAAAIICRLLGMEEEAKQARTTSFTDVPTNHWANGYVAKAAEQGIINGYGNGKFGPSDSVTYVQMVKMLVCAWGYEEDARTAGGWPNGYLSVANSLGIVNTTISDPANAALRADVAVLSNNTLMIAPADYSIEH